MLDFNINMVQIVVLLVPFFSAVIGHSIYKHVLGEDDIAEIFDEDES